MAGDAQVLCVTHLPQVAAQGENHLLVEKRGKGKTSPRALDDDERVAKSRVCSEERVTEVAHADAWRRENDRQHTGPRDLY
jgi:DNA repair protein RecN (Recombination protein N)